AILTDSLFALAQKKCRMRRWRVLSSLLLLIRSAFASTPPQNQPAPQHH
ncbi:magnesium transporter CorA, partial [Escherichia coli]|nr:magnesium transporter CorA [Escherichia coli]